jgi:hypothetical protein
MEKNTMASNKDDVLFVRTTKDFKRKVVTVASVLQSDASQFSRDAIYEKIEALAQTNPEVAEALKRVA